MNFNYRDFFIHNDDLHIIKEQLSILDEIGVSIEDALAPNAKAVWDMYDKGEELDEQKIADKLGINVDTVKKIIDICDTEIYPNGVGEHFEKTINFGIYKLNTNNISLYAETICELLSSLSSSYFLGFMTCVTSDTNRY